MRNYTPFFPNNEKGISYSQSGVFPKTTNTTFYKNNDLYETTALALDRAINIGCTGYRNVVINATGQYRFAPCSSADTYKTIMKQMPKTYVERRYYDFDPNKNVYDIMNSINDNLYTGFNYENKLMELSVSNVIYRDPVKAGILHYFQRVVYALIETTKQIKNFVNYTVKKNNQRVF